MKLFDDFEAVKFSEENMIFITRNRFLYYIYIQRYDCWRMHENCGNDSITVANYDDVTKEELMAAMKGVFPQKATDFMRLCNPEQLCIRDMLALLEEDYRKYTSDCKIREAVHKFLLNSDICHRTYAEIKCIFKNAEAACKGGEQVLSEIKELSRAIIGRDIFRQEIEIADGCYGASYFRILPARVIDNSDTDNSDNVATMRRLGISIEENDVFQYLFPFLRKHYDDELEANRNRIEDRYTDDDGNEHISRISGFEWYSTRNFFTFDSIAAIVEEIKETIDALTSGKENEFTAEVKNDTSPEVIIDFYNRFIYRMQYMTRVGKEKGYNLVTFIGP